MKKSYTFIVIGGGSAGCVIASRLRERPDVSVLLVEAGGGDSSILLAMPLAFRMLRTANLFDWGFASETEAHAGNRSLPAARGRVLGGSSSTNGMMYSRGHPRDYDLWAQAGATGWSYEDVLPFFRRSESNWRGASTWHGADGPLRVEALPDQDVLTTACYEAAKSLGYALTTDFEGDRPEGFGLPDVTTRAGKRASASRAFLAPATARGNLSIITNAQCRRIIIEKGRAVGVEVNWRGRIREIRADKEIVLSAGAYGSPHVLMLSGIGPAEHLRQFGIAVQVDAPGVGQGLQEHPLVAMGFRGKKPFTMRAHLRADRIALSALHWFLMKKGPLASIPLTACGFLKSQEGLERPDWETLLMPTSLSARVWVPYILPPREDIMTVLNVTLQPRSRGTVALRSADPSDKPKIAFNILSDAYDLEILRRSIAKTRELAATAPLSDYLGDEAFPGKGVASGAELESYIRNTVVTAQHPTSTCRMGMDENAVVDLQLRVHGLDGLRVADASIMPTVISGHTNAPCIMIGERAAEWMLKAL